MTVLARMTAVVVVVLAGSYATGRADAQAPGDRTVEQYKCKDLMRESGSNRDVAIAFLHGYLTGKSGSSKFNVDIIHKQTNAFIERCLDNPNETALDAMLSVR